MIYAFFSGKDYYVISGIQDKQCISFVDQIERLLSCFSRTIQVTYPQEERPLELIKISLSDIFMSVKHGWVVGERLLVNHPVK